MLEKLKRDLLVVSVIVRLVRGIEIARIAAAAGFDSLYVDMEHGSMSLETCGQICVAALDAGITPLVRVGASKDAGIGRVLDAGALGVIVPHVTSAAEARDAVAQARSAPRGRRSHISNPPQLGFRSIPSAEAALDDATVVAVQIESLEALANVHEIAATDGVDLLLVGTNDLAADLGIAGKYDDPRIRDAYARTIDACRGAGKFAGVGGLTSRPDLIRSFVQMGARYVSAGSDLALLMSALERQAASVHAFMEKSA